MVQQGIPLKVRPVPAKRPLWLLFGAVRNGFSVDPTFIARLWAVHGLHKATAIF